LYQETNKRQLTKIQKSTLILEVSNSNRMHTYAAGKPLTGGHTLIVSVFLQLIATMQRTGF